MASRVNRITSHLLEPQAAANLGVITLEEAKDKGGVRLTMVRARRGVIRFSLTVSSCPSQSPHRPKIPGIYAVVVEYVRFLLEVSPQCTYSQNT